VRTRRTALTVVLAVVLVLGAAGAWLGSRSPDSTAAPQAAARTSFPDLEPAASEPMLPSLQTLHPASGSVVEAPGPFDDRFHFQLLAFAGATVSGTAAITSDVSDLLELEVQVGFYDRNGVLVGTASDVHHLDESSVDHAREGVPVEKHRFAVDVPRELRGVAVAAAVGVPVLVNE
jgi:hypothetical protein